MKTNQDLVREFHEAFGMPTHTRPGFPGVERRKLRMSLILEEVEELSTALATKNMSDVIDALGDLLYVTYGTGIEFGIDLDRAVAIIHQSNMSKLGADGLPIYREDGKVMKGPNFKPPDFSELLK